MHLSGPVINRDGSIAVSVAVPVDSSNLPREALSWILRLGLRVDMLGPPHMHEYWLRELAAPGAPA